MPLILRPPRWLVWAAVACCAAALCGASSLEYSSDSILHAAEGDSWDGEEFEGMETLTGSSAWASGHGPASESSDVADSPDGRLAPQHDPKNWWPEALVVLFLIVYVIFFFKGRAANDAIATAWADAFAREGGILERNFSLLGGGEGPELLVKESQSVFRFYASGRRHCSWLSATLELVNRQDLLSVIWEVVSPSQDRLDIEVCMNEGSMQQMVLLVAAPKVAKEMVKDLKDLEDLTHRVDVGRDRLAAWPGDKLVAYAEHSSLLYDLMVDQVVDLLFSKGTFEPLARYWRYMHFTTDMVDESVQSGATSQAPKKVLRFSFVLPSAERMEEVGKLLTAVTLLIDVVGQHKLSPEQQKRATQVRADLAKVGNKEKQELRMEELARKKQEAKLSELERLKKLAPEARRKAMEKKERQEAKRQSKQGMKILK